MIGSTEFINRLAKEEGITKTRAKELLNTFLDLMATACVDDGGISFKGFFTIKKKFRKGRTGRFGDGKEWKSEDKYVLSIDTGCDMLTLLNIEK